MPSPLKIDIISDPDQICLIQGEWHNLYNDDPDATPFQSWEWSSAWWNTFGGRRKPELLTIREGGDWVALFPLYISQTPWRSLRWVGTGMSDILQPLVRDGYRDAVQSHWREYVESLRKVDLLDLHQIRDGHWLVQMGDGDEQAQCPLLDLPSSFEAYLNLLSKSLRYEAKKALRTNFEWRQSLTGHWGLENFEIFLDLHQKRWNRRGLPGAFALPKVQQFHRAFLQSACESGIARLTTLWLDGAPIGAIYLLRSGHATYFYQSGFDPAAKRHSPGTALVAVAIRDAITEGSRVFDFLRGDEPYKMRWKPQRTVKNLRMLKKFPGHWLGSVGNWFNRTEHRIEHRVRARLEGKGILG